MWLWYYHEIKLFSDFIADSRHPDKTIGEVLSEFPCLSSDFSGPLGKEKRRFYKDKIKESIIIKQMQQLGLRIHDVDFVDKEDHWELINMENLKSSIEAEYPLYERIVQLILLLKMNSDNKTSMDVSMIILDCAIQELSKMINSRNNGMKLKKCRVSRGGKPSSFAFRIRALYDYYFREVPSNYSFVPSASTCTSSVLMKVPNLHEIQTAMLGKYGEMLSKALSVSQSVNAVVPSSDCKGLGCKVIVQEGRVCSENESADIEILKKKRRRRTTDKEISTDLIWTVPVPHLAIPEMPELSSSSSFLFDDIFDENLSVFSSSSDL